MSQNVKKVPDSGAAQRADRHTPTMIGRIERGDYMPTIPQLEKLAEILEFRLEELWQEDENDQIKKDTSKKTKKTPMIRPMKNRSP